jgi:hypothetical protein
MDTKGTPQEARPTTVLDMLLRLPLLELEALV